MNFMYILIFNQERKKLKRFFSAASHRITGLAHMIALNNFPIVYTNTLLDAVARQLTF